jgi:hypothetical protein
MAGLIWVQGQGAIISNSGWSENIGAGQYTLDKYVYCGIIRIRRVILLLGEFKDEVQL